MSREKADEWVEGKPHVVLVEIILPEYIGKDGIAGLIHKALRAEYPSLGSMEYHAFVLADHKLRRS